MQKRKTKIVCSLGPSTSEDSVIRELILAGMNVARLNFSHGTHESHNDSVERVRRISNELGIPVAIMLDTRGPEIRTGKVENDGKVTINKGDAVIVTVDDCFTTEAKGDSPACISITWKAAPERLQTGHLVLVADGLLELEVMENKGGVVKCRANNTAVIGSKKNVNLIGIHANLPIIDESDKKDLAFGIKMDIDFIAASFVSFPEEITEIRTFLAERGSSIKIIAKIENGEGLDNIKEIAAAADGVMVARGDLGVQLPTEQIPLAQKNIINVCRRVGKPVITATQMLESMIVNPRPTRAELTDVANAIFDGTDAVMLSGETASGAYPVEAVKTMDKIARTVEQSAEFRTRMETVRGDCLSQVYNPKENLGVIMTRSGVDVAAAVNAKAIVTPTYSGNTARLLSAFRPHEPIFAVTTDLRAERAMQLWWGVETSIRPKVEDTETMIQDTMKVVLNKGGAGISDKVVLVAGLPLNSPNMVNAIRVVILGTVLTRSDTGGCANPNIVRACGRIIQARSPQEARERIMSYGGGEILVCHTLTEEYTPIIRLVGGVICESVSEISDQQLSYINPRLVWLTNVKDATNKLESGLTVTIDAKQLLLYEGSL
ncbi:MAG: pyruvate kinase [Spirochaetes bacterium]|nr:pyruvate kinase [Spirochaetota bacterium]